MATALRAMQLVGRLAPIMARNLATCNLDATEVATTLRQDGEMPAPATVAQLGKSGRAAAAVVGKTAAPQLSCLPALSGYIHAIGGSLGLLR